MPARLRSVSFPADDATTAAAFWAGLLGRRAREDAKGWIVPGDGTQLGLRFVVSRRRREGLNRMHVHLTSTDAEHQAATVAAALASGARHLDVGQRPDEGHVVLADPAGNEFCVIPPGNRFLAGTGLLGELACDGSRAAGVFWSAALGWPLVWDQDGETAVQSPHGGTKVAWGGPPVRPVSPFEPQYVDLVVPGADAEAEVARLMALGATRVRLDEGDVVLADPDGVQLHVSVG